MEFEGMNKTIWVSLSEPHTRPQSMQVLQVLCVRMVNDKI